MVWGQKETDGMALLGTWVWERGMDTRETCVLPVLGRCIILA